MLQNGALTSFTLYELYRKNTAHAQSVT